MSVIKGIISTCIKTSKVIKQDNITMYAAQSAFFLILSAFPFVMMLLTTIKYLPFEQTEFVNAVNNFFPKSVRGYFGFMIDEIYNTTIGFGAIVSLIVMIWSASKGIMSVSDGLDNINRIETGRNYFIRRTINALYTILFCIMMIVVMLLYILGDVIKDKLDSIIGRVAAIDMIYFLLRVAFGPIVVFLVVLIAYSILPSGKMVVRRNIAGAVFTTVCWILLALGLSVYVKVIGENTYMYGSLAGIILVIFWIYISMYILFLGAELNKVKEQSVRK